MSKRYIIVVLCSILSIWTHTYVFAQNPGDPGDIYLLKSKFKDSAGKKNLEAFFIVWTKNKSDFPPIIITPAVYQLNLNGKEKEYKLDDGNLSIVKYNRRKVEKDTTLASLVTKLSHYVVIKHYFVVKYTIRGIENEFSTLRFYAAFAAKKNPNTHGLIAPPIELK